MRSKFVHAALAAIGLACAASAFAQSKPLVYSSYLPPTHASNKHGLEPLFKAVEQDTRGSLKIELHPGGSMVPGKGTLQAMRDGLIDGGFAVSLYHQNEIPLNVAFSDLALLAEDPLATMGAINETVLLHCKECLDEYAKYKTVYLGAYSTTPYVMMCKKPVQTLADLKGLKMRAAGTVYGRLATALGGVPVTITNAEAYEALQRGQLDCMIGAISWLQTLSLWDTTKNVIDLPMGAYFGGAFIAFNEGSWKKMKPEDRQAFVKRVPEALARLAIGYAQDDIDVVGQARGKGVTIRKPDEAMVKLVAQYREEEIRNAIEAAKKRGVRDPEPAIRKFVATLAKWNGIVAKIGHDREKFEQALRTEIYDKVKF